MSAPNAASVNTMPVESKMSPMPTSGETNPPDANPSAPSKADAVPEWVRSAFKAKALEEVNEKPKVTNNPISKIS